MPRILPSGINQVFYAVHVGLQFDIAHHLAIELEKHALDINRDAFRDEIQIREDALKRNTRAVHSRIIFWGAGIELGPDFPVGIAHQGVQSFMDRGQVQASGIGDQDHLARREQVEFFKHFSARPDRIREIRTESRLAVAAERNIPHLPQEIAGLGKLRLFAELTAQSLLQEPGELFFEERNID